MHKIKKILLSSAKKYLQDRVPDKGLAKLAHQALKDKPCYALVPEGTTPGRAESLLEGGLTSWQDTLPALIEILKREAEEHSNSFLCVQMLVAGPKDFPYGEDFEVSSRPHRLIIDGVVYLSMPISDMNAKYLSEFINYDIGFGTAIILLDSPLTDEWLMLASSEKENSILSISYDIYDGESFLLLKKIGD